MSDWLEKFARKGARANAKARREEREREETAQREARAAWLEYKRKEAEPYRALGLLDVIGRRHETARQAAIRNARLKQPLAELRRKAEKSRRANGFWTQEHEDFVDREIL